MRSIPAWAGQPFGERHFDIGSTVYPRVGGATDVATGNGYTLYGLSPRGRGNQRGTEREYLVFGSIPAWAGQPSLLSTRL